MRGPSHAQLVKCEDEKYYVVKFMDRVIHPRALANEMLAARLARLVGLLVPDHALIRISAQLAADARNNKLLRGPTWPEGLHFGSAYPGVPGQTLVVDFLPEALLRRSTHLTSILLGAFVFDTWTYNRGARQIIFSRTADDKRSGYSPWLIDHDLCFNGPKWTFPTTPVPCNLRRRVANNSCGAHSFEPFLSRIEELEPSQVEQCVRGIPEVWYGKNSQEILDLAERLYERRRRVREDIVSIAQTPVRHRRPALEGEPPASGPPTLFQPNA